MWQLEVLNTQVKHAPHRLLLQVVENLSGKLPINTTLAALRALVPPDSSHESVVEFLSFKVLETKMTGEPVGQPV
jgi:hypothetical protein